MTHPDGHDAHDDPEEASPATEFADAGEWFHKWFRHAMAGHFDAGHRWCSLWWKHQPVAVRMSALWRAWEAARANSDDGAAMSAWWVYHADSHWRSITAPNGPLHQCTPDKHTDTGGLPQTPPPPGWFDTP